MNNQELINRLNKEIELTKRNTELPVEYLNGMVDAYEYVIKLITNNQCNTSESEHHYKVVIWADAGNDFFGNEWKYVDLSAPTKTREEAEEIVKIISTYTDIWELEQLYNHPEDGLYTNLTDNKPQVVETNEPLNNPWIYFGGKPLSPKC